MIPSFRDPAPPEETNPRASSVVRTGRALHGAIASEPDKCVRRRGEMPRHAGSAPSPCPPPGGRTLLRSAGACDMISHPHRRTDPAGGTMAFRDLREFLSALEARRELKKIPAPVSMDLVGTMGRMCLALGVSSLDEIGLRMMEVIEPEIPSNLIEKLKMLPKLARLADFIPKTISTGPCQEVVEKERPSLSFLPVVKTWPGDGGPFITLPLVFTKDPNTGRRNVGMYRMHVYDETTTGMHWHIHKGGAQHYRGFRRKRERMPVAVALGGDPATIYAATAPLPEDIDEMLFAGFLRKEPG